MLESNSNHRAFPQSTHYHVIVRLTGGGGCLLVCEEFLENIRLSIPRLRLLLLLLLLLLYVHFLVVVVVFKVEICSRTLIPLFRQGSVHSGSVI